MSATELYVEDNFKDFVTGIESEILVLVFVVDLHPFLESKISFLLISSEFGL